MVQVEDVSPVHAAPPERNATHLTSRDIRRLAGPPLDLPPDSLMTIPGSLLHVATERAEKIALDYGLLAAGLFFGRCRSWELKQRKKVESVIEFFELESYRKHPAGDLPYGIQKLIGLARAFAAEPRLVLLDEPSAGLNREEKEDLARYLLRARHKFSPTMIWIEHDMQLVRDLADKVLVLHYGKELAFGGPDEVLSNARVIEAYIGKQ